MPQTSVPEPEAEQPRLTRVPYYAQSTNPRPFGEPAATFDFDLSFLDQPVADLSSSMYAATVTPQDSGSFRSAYRKVFESERVTTATFTGIDEVFDSGDNAILPDVPQGREVMGGWFDPNDVPPAIRDHL